MGLTNVKFEAKDVASINEYEKYYLIIAFEVIYNQAPPAKVLKETTTIFHITKKKGPEGFEIRTSTIHAHL
jgi:hypothetical protein